MALVKASRAAAQPEEAFALAKLAVDAAPSDPRTHSNLSRMAAFEHRSFGLAAREMSRAAASALLDPWFQGALATKLLAAVWAASVFAGLSLTALLLLRHGRCLLHDYADVFPRNLRRFTPPAFLLLAAVGCWGAGFGTGALLLLVGLSLLPYLSPKLRWTLGVALTLSCTGWIGLERYSQLAGDPGDRAWAYYRAFKGDGGSDLDAGLARKFPSRDYEALLARAGVARRMGRYDQARTLLNNAIAAGADEGSTRIELGNVSFLDRRPDDALAQYGQAVALRPRDPIPWINLHVVYLETLRLGEADRALENARSLGASEVEHFQRGSVGANSPLLPISLPLGGNRARMELLFGRGTASPWTSALARSVFVSIDGVHPWHLGAVALLVTVLAGRAHGRSRSYRCPSCGAVVCPRCSRRIRGSETCAACWALANRKDAESFEKDRQREAVSRWTERSKRAQRLLRAAFPGWSEFADTGSASGLAWGVVWSVSGGALLLGALYPVSASPWGIGGPGWLPWIPLLLCHLVVLRRKRLRFRAAGRT